jgi:tetratricopeptide (TPR) repeat protein
MREAVVAQERARRNASQRPRHGVEAQDQARLDAIERLAYAGNLRGARETLVRYRPTTEHIADRIDRLRAYVACASGELDLAIALATSIRHEAHPRVRAQAAATLGSALRQQRRYAEAERVERRALRLGAERAHLLAGLAADAVGVGDAWRASRRIRAATAALPAREPRARIRVAWATCERALLVGRPDDAVAAAAAALRRARLAGFRRHEAKSGLFLGVALREQSSPGWRRRIEDARSLASAIGAELLAAAADGLLAEAER